MVDAIAHVTVGVADLQPVYDLWSDRFGLETVARRAGPDADLARLWNIPASRIADQALLRTPGAETGWLHFVQFNEPDTPVRQGAAATDLGPKSLDVNCRDMPVRVTGLQSAGYSFRSEIGEYRVEEIHAREVQISGHDQTNIVLIEILSGGFGMNYSPAGYAALTSFVVVVPDTKSEAGFFAELFGLDELMHHRISGPGIEKAVGLPSGSVLDMRLMGRDQKFFGRVELIAYEGLGGSDRFKLAKPPALGTLHCTFAVKSLNEFLHRAENRVIENSIYDGLETIFCSGRVCSVYSPSGLRIDVYEQG